jgi:Peptidase A4 family
MIRWRYAIAGAVALGLTMLAPEVASASASPTTVPTYAGNGAFYAFNGTSHQVSTVVVVPSISCAHNPAGTYAGQAALVQLWSHTSSGYGVEEAGIRSYCDGTVPVYETEFGVNDVVNSAEVFSPAGVPVRPGDLVKLEATANSSEATLQITDLTNRHSACKTGAGFIADVEPVVGIGSVAATASGAPIISGTVPNGTSAPTMAGPVPARPYVFLGSLVDYTPLARFTNLYSAYWFTNGTTVATVSPISCGGNFTATIAP